MAQLKGEGPSVKRIVSGAAKASLGLLMLGGGSAAAQVRSAEGSAASAPAEARSIQSMPRSNRDCDADTTPAAPSVTAIIKHGLERTHVAPLLDPNDTLIWGGAHKDTFETTLPIAYPVDGQVEYFLPVQTGRTLSRHQIATMSLKRYNQYLADSYKTLKLEQITDPGTIVDGTQYSSALNPSSFLSPTGNFVGSITNNTIGFQPAVRVGLSDGSAPLEPVGFTDYNPDRTAQN